MLQARCCVRLCVGAARATLFETMLLQRGLSAASLRPGRTPTFLARRSPGFVASAQVAERGPDFEAGRRPPAFEAVRADHWDDWRWQMAAAVRTPERLARVLPLSAAELAGCEASKKRLALAITPYFLGLLGKEGCPLRRQVVPQPEEALLGQDEALDPVAEEASSPAPGIVHRYPDRVLFLVTAFCTSYCRYCFRSRLVSDARGYGFQPELEAGLAYIVANPEIRDVLISGGDPLLLSDGKLDELLGRLRAIPHVEFVRLGTRAPVFLPQRVTPGLCEVLRKHGPIWLSLHVNHPAECTAELHEALSKLRLAGGCVLGNQSVLLRGVNDDAGTMKALQHRLLRMAVHPYYVHSCDVVQGAGHFRVDLRKALEIMESLRGHTTGYAVPHFVVDAPGGGGKVPLNGQYVVGYTEEHVVLRNFEGRLFKYPLYGAASGLSPPPSSPPLRPDAEAEATGRGVPPLSSLAMTAPGMPSGMALAEES